MIDIMRRKCFFFYPSARRKISKAFCGKVEDHGEEAV